MKHTLLYIMLLTVSLTANAQIENLDEIELLGTWNVIDKAGIFNTAQFPVYNSERKRPAAFVFADNSDSAVAWEFASGIEYQYYPGYWLTHTSDRYILHMATRLGYNGYTSLSLLNFIVTRFSDNTMTLQTYSGDGTLYLTKDTSAGVRSVSMDAGENSKAYLLNGSVAPENSKGVVITDGKKVIR